MLILKGPAWAVHALFFSPDAATLYAVHGNGIGVHAWNLAERTVAPLKTAAGFGVFDEFAIHPGGKWAFGQCSQPRYAVHKAQAIDLTTGRTRPINFLGSVRQQPIASAPDGRHVVTLGHSDFDSPRRGTTHAYRLYGWKMTATGPRYAWYCDTPDDAKALRVVYTDNETLVTEDWVPKEPLVTVGYQHSKPRLCVRSATTGKPIQTVDVPTEYVEQLLASPDGKQVVVRRGTKLWIWDTTDWKKPPTAVPGTDYHNIDARAAAFDPSGRYLLLANNGPSILVFDTTTWKHVRKWKWDAGVLRAVAVSADGTLAAASGPRGTVVVWDWDL